MRVLLMLSILMGLNSAISDPLTLEQCKQLAANTAASDIAKIAASASIMDAAALSLRRDEIYSKLSTSDLLILCSSSKSNNMNNLDYSFNNALTKLNDGSGSEPYTRAELTYHINCKDNHGAHEGGLVDISFPKSSSDGVTGPSDTTKYLIELAKDYLEVVDPDTGKSIIDALNDYIAMAGDGAKQDAEAIKFYMTQFLSGTKAQQVAEVP